MKDKYQSFEEKCELFEDLAIQVDIDIVDVMLYHYIVFNDYCSDIRDINIQSIIEKIRQKWLNSENLYNLDDVVEQVVYGEYEED